MMYMNILYTCIVCECTLISISDIAKWSIKSSKGNEDVIWLDGISPGALQKNEINSTENYLHTSTDYIVIHVDHNFKQPQINGYRICAIYIQ